VRSGRRAYSEMPAEEHAPADWGRRFADHRARSADWSNWGSQWHEPNNWKSGWQSQPGWGSGGWKAQSSGGIVVVPTSKVPVPKEREISVFALTGREPSAGMLTFNSGPWRETPDGTESPSEDGETVGSVARTTPRTASRRARRCQGCSAALPRSRKQTRTTEGEALQRLASDRCRVGQSC